MIQNPGLIYKIKTSLYYKRVVKKLDCFDVHASVKEYSTKHKISLNHAIQFFLPQFQQ